MVAGSASGCKHCGNLLRLDDNDGDHDKDDDHANKLNIHDHVLLKTSTRFLGLTSLKYPQRNHPGSFIGHCLAGHGCRIAANVGFSKRVGPGLKQKLGMFGILRVGSHVQRSSAIAVTCIGVSPAAISALSEEISGLVAARCKGVEP
jgi:carbonic anhydrase/acetyltransferase-like protein (isoleucine patch superfamily)